MFFFYACISNNIMGQAVSISTNKVEVVNETLTEILQSQTALCRNTAMGVQVINVSDLKCKKIKISGVSQESKIVATLNCHSSQKLSAEITNQLKQKLESKAEAAAGPLSSTTISDNLTKNINKLTTRLQNSQFAECAMNSIATQAQNFSSMDCGPDGEIDIGKIEQKLNLDAVAKCILNQSGLAEVATAIDNDIKAASDAKAMGIAGGLGSSTSSSISICICISLIIAFKLS